MANKSRPHQMLIRVNDDELKLIREKIKMSGLTQQKFLLKAITEDNKVIRAVMPIPDDLKNIYRELKIQGNNLNQLIKKLHEKNFIDYKRELPLTLEELRNAWQHLNTFLENWQK